MEKDNERGESGDGRGVSRSEMEGRKGARHARNAAMKKYRARLLEVRNFVKITLSDRILLNAFDHTFDT
jgi:hypothetical protein